MSNELVELNINQKFNIDEMFKELENVPLGNTVYQYENHSPDTQDPIRRYRQCMLEYRKVMAAIYAARHAKLKHDIEIDEIDYKISKIKEGALTPKKHFALRRLEANREEKVYLMKNSLCLVKDAFIRAAYWKKEKEKVGPFTREQIEENERKYWPTRLSMEADDEIRGNQVGLSKGTIRALRKTGLAVVKDPSTGLTLIHDYGSEKKLIESRMAGQKQIAEEQESTKCQN